MPNLQIDPDRVAEIVEEFRELAKTMDESEAARMVGTDYGLTAEQIRHLAKNSTETDSGQPPL